MMANRANLLELGGINFTEAMSRFGDNEALFERLAEKFLDDPHFTALEKALAIGDNETALREAHTLKGVAGNLSFDKLYQAASQVNDDLREDNTPAAIAHMKQVRASYTATIEALRAVFR